MAYIYQITNLINGKIYIGKTEFSIEKRWKEHCKDAFTERCEERPLYKAIRKYGVNNFNISLLEETDCPEERERFWIEEKRSFKYGYNATLGGDGRPYLDYDVLIATYKQTQNLTKTAELCHCDRHHLSNILKSHNVSVLSKQQVFEKQFGKTINQYSLNGEFIQSFPSTHAAASFVRPDSQNIAGVGGHIGQVCSGKRKTAYGYIWKFAPVE